MSTKKDKDKEKNIKISPIIVGTCLCKRKIEEITIPYYEKIINEYPNLKFEYIEKEGGEFTSDTHNKLLITIKDKYKNKIKGVVIIGSDDIVSLSALEFYNNLSNKEANVIHGIDRLYVYDVFNNNMYLASKTNRFKTGAGRFYPVDLLKKIDYILYKPGIKNGLDHNAYELCKVYGYIDIREVPNAYVIDCKTDKNITPLNRIVGPKDKLDSWGEASHPLLSEVKNHFDTNIKIEDGCYYSVMIIDDRLGNIGEIIKMEGSTVRALLTKNLIEVISKI